MGRWRDQSDARHRVARISNVLRHLVPGQFAALTRLRTLRHLDLQIVGVRDVGGRHTEPPGSYLLDRRSTVVLRVLVHVPVRVLTALARVALAANAIHRDGERLMRLERNTAETHGTRREALHDLTGRLHLRQVNLRAASACELQLTAQRTQLHAVHGRIAERRVRVLALIHGRFLQGGDRRRLIDMPLATSTPVELARIAQDLCVGVPCAIHELMPLETLPGHHLQTDATDARMRPAEAHFDHIRAHADGFENLRPLVRLQRRDAHLGHHLQDAGLNGRGVRAIDGIVGQGRIEHALVSQRTGHLEHQVRADRICTVPEEHAHVVHLARLRRLHD
uniref:Uncharacterized protein n=1 Tax=Anopheles atroparvus TaxID=41427 RepID=A0AAG5D4V1_ANOAO